MSKTNIKVKIILAIIFIVVLILVFIQKYHPPLKVGIEEPDMQKKSLPEEKREIPKETKLPVEDVDGFDLKDVPRYPGSVRTTCLERKSEITINYLTEDKQKEVIQYYADKMPDFGWKKKESSILGSAHLQLFTKLKYECQVWIVEEENTLIAITRTNLVKKNRS